MRARVAATLVAAALMAAGCDRARDAEAAPPPGAPAGSSQPAGTATSSPSTNATAGSDASAGSATSTQGAAGPTGHAEPEGSLRAVPAVSGQPIARTLTLDSHLMVERDVGVTVRRDGVIDGILADRGQTVKEGQPLARLEQGDWLLSEQAALLELQKEQSSFDRARRLSEQGVMSDEEFEQIRLRRDAAEKSLERMRWDLEKGVIRAPFDGVVSGRYVEKGQVVREDDRRTLFQVTALGPLLARVYVPEWALLALDEGQPAWIALGGETALPARVRWINDVLDAASGSAEMFVELLPGQAAARLRPGMSVQVRLELSFQGLNRIAGVVSLPREALGPGQPSYGEQVELSVLDADGAARPRAVAIGFVGDRLVEIRRGLAAGERVLVPAPSP